MGTCSTNLCVQFVGHSLQQTYLKGTHSFCWLYTGSPFNRLPIKGFKASKIAPISFCKSRIAKKNWCFCISIRFISGPTIDDHGSRSLRLLDLYWCQTWKRWLLQYQLLVVRTLQLQALAAPSAQSSRAARKCPNSTAYEIYHGCKLGSKRSQWSKNQAHMESTRLFLETYFYKVFGIVKDGE